MIKYNFKNDYSEGADPRVMEELLEANKFVYDGYGYDTMTEKARETIKKAVGNDNIDINFLSGGTLTNIAGIKTFLRPHESIISADIGHINGHECGAIEATGHKILLVSNKDGKILPQDIENIMEENNNETVTAPKLVYLSNAMENGLTYNKEELTEISKVCKAHNLFLFLDGARLGAALSSLQGNLTLQDISYLVDAFYIGGTKNGILLGEALIVCNDEFKKIIRYTMKQSGAILAKTWTIAVQFYALFKDGLYYELADNGVNQAKIMYDGMRELGFEFGYEFSTNTIFPIMDNDFIKKIGENYLFEEWEKVDSNRTTVRLVTSWATKESAVKEFLKDCREIIGK